MPRSTGEMPFLDHLEELRSRILRSLLAIVACFAVGLWLVNRFHLVDLLKRPIAEYLPGGQLTVLSPTEPLMIVLKLSLIVGLVLASPILLWQLWAFLSPALYEKEKKTLVPALFVGLALFLTGGSLAFLFIVPQALRVLMGVQSGSFNPMITYDAYFSFVMQIVLALGLSCELPLLMIILAGLGIVATPLLNRVRPYAVVGSFIAGAVLSPGADVLSMFMLTIPLLLLYEIGVAGVWLVQKRKRKAEAATGALLILLCLVPSRARAQQPFPPTPGRPGQPVLPGQGPRDTLQKPGGPRRLDSASARRLGLPSAPRLTFPVPDSIMVQLMELEGYEITKYRADSATVRAADKAVDLKGNAMTDRNGAIVEAAQIRYREGDCGVEATGEPHMFQNGQVLIGESARFDTCKERGVIRDALTQLSEGGGNWFIRGNLAIDQNQSRLYGGNAELTSCDLPIPHYHFSAKEMKWVSKSVMVARPAVLYIRDVPVAWIPFIFQDTKSGRHSGILIPQFGFNDIVRPTEGYNRQVTNIGYYWAPNDYFDAQLQLDWFNNRYLQWGITTQYRILNRFVAGNLSYSVQQQSGGGTGKSIAWAHNQSFNNSTSLSVDARYATNTSILSRNSIDPRTTTQEIRSGANFTKRFAWGTLAMGLSGHQNINDGSAQLTAPTLTLSPKSIDIGRSITWSPGLSFTNVNDYKTPNGVLLTPGGPGQVDSTKLFGHTRRTQMSLQTPLRFGSFNWANSVDVIDNDSTGRYKTDVKIPDLSTPEPNDSITVSRFRTGGFSTTIDWNTGINLPILFSPTWKFSPSIGITNSGPGAFAVRNALTGGNFVYQGKRLSFGASIAPTFFAFFPGFAGMAKIRHSVSPQVTWSYSPPGTIPADYARAVGRPDVRKTIASQTVTLALSQNFEAKSQPTGPDTTGTNARKFRLLSIQTSSIGFDIEKAKEPGQTGWTTQNLSNTLASDLLPGFSLSLSHNLWEGQVGLKSSKFKPFLESVNAGFAVTGHTFQQIGSMLGLVKRPAEESRDQRQQQVGVGGVALPGDLRRNLILNPNQTI
ncbi:MAG TPA: twin-arginine translocase subunit TatC, partial [Gemmatimonadales bacterium]|nr:twin-arginine translocase subunit TatC [Gemmatimonadales bacterium]